MEHRDRRLAAYVDLITDEIRQDWSAQGALYPIAEAKGLHILPVHYYTAIPTQAEVRAAAGTRILDANSEINFNTAQQLAFLKIIREYAAELSDVPLKSDRAEYAWDNGMFAFQDASAYYAIARHFKPRRIIEIGCGSSTLVAAAAAKRNGSTEVIAIEPYPLNFYNRYLKEMAEGQSEIRLIEQKIQDVDLELFKTLDSGDILFVDNSHVSRTGSDVNHVFFKILPIIKPGVLIHFHDIFLPYEYPQVYYDRLWFFGEQYLLGTYLMNNSSCSILFSSFLLSAEFRNEYTDVLSNFLDAAGRLKAYPDFTGPVFGGSFWIRRNT